jgi:hypothetical protein
MIVAKHGIIKEAVPLVHMIIGAPLRDAVADAIVAVRFKKVKRRHENSGVFSLPGR